MTGATTLAEKQTELARAKARLAAAEFGGYTQGDRAKSPPDLESLRLHVAALAREVAELQAAANGATNPLFLTASWS